MNDCLTLIASERTVISTGFGQQPISPRVRKWNDKNISYGHLVTITCDGTRHQKSYK